MVQVRDMRMAVGDSLMRMLVRVPGARVEAGLIMGVIVMPVIMGVLVHVRDHLVVVFVGMAVREQQRHHADHQQGGAGLPERHAFTEKHR